VHQNSARQTLQAAVDLVRARSSLRPRVALILGSGLGELADRVATPVRVPFADLPGHPQPTVVGHAGEIVLGRFAGVPIVVWRGRVHFYEGCTMGQVAYPVRLAQRLGAEVLILTNAAGGLNEQFMPGDLMLVEDHLNLPGLVGHNPLRGPHDPADGERFVDLTAAYDPDLRRLAEESARQLGFVLRRGVYAMVAGPHYETPAEGRLLRILGADAVGMSTVPEVVVARQAGLRVVAISAITNAVLPPAAATSHAEVLDVAERLVPRFSALLLALLAAIGANPGMS
jgi:purine-nucleoside phosphorylase